MWGPHHTSVASAYGGAHRVVHNHPRACITFAACAWRPFIPQPELLRDSGGHTMTVP